MYAVIENLLPVAVRGHRQATGGVLPGGLLPVNCW